MANYYRIIITEQIDCVERELRFRGYVYPRRVSAGKMTQAQADQQISHMQAVLQTLQHVRDGKANELATLSQPGKLL